MESVFLRFESYDFEADLRFQDGLKDLNKCNKSREETKLLDLKLFFYNRFVEPIDRSSYQQWSSASPRATPMDCGVEQQDQRRLSDSGISPNQTAETEAKQLDQRTLSDSGISPNQTAETEAKQLSFAEVMRLVQEGKEVPGATKPDIKATNQSPTPSQMQRRLKPWEISSVSK
ncbi:hypothetical protein PFLUV_G00054930 [Perca fluviatilis]|uniref:Uncharacterized protein n=1 Tax=Perca fluviatilis TaxID=8168 RepID=A0A6A5FLV6_PERFL|nr:hypothetical protein PFLUV_G00054930 [Perca fluviatilis]